VRVESPVPALDNREFALVAWILLGLAASVFSKSLRASLGSVLKTLLGWKLLLIFGSMTLYLGALVFLLSLAGLWTADLVSETVFWFLFSGLVILFRAVSAGGQEDFFKRTVFSVFALTAISEFVLNLRPLGLVLELLLVPVLVLLFGTLAVAEARLDDRHVRGLLQGLIVAIGLLLLAYTLIGMVTDPPVFMTYVNLLQFLLPILLTAGVIPFVYGIALLTTYGSLFSRLNWKLDRHRATRRCAKRRVLRAGHVRLERAHRLASRLAWLVGFDDEDEAVDRAIAQALEPKPEG
jgi:hypothetical protein